MGSQNRRLRRNRRRLCSAQTLRTPRFLPRNYAFTSIENPIEAAPPQLRSGFSASSESRMPPKFGCLVAGAGVGFAEVKKGQMNPPAISSFFACTQLPRSPELHSGLKEVFKGGLGTQQASGPDA